MTGMVEVPAEAPAIARYARALVSFRDANRQAEPSWHNGAVGSFGQISARLLIVGLAPGLKGANRTGRPFTGDFAGDLLYATLLELGFARGRYAAAPDDTLSLIDCMITNAVRCVPPAEQTDAGRDQHVPALPRQPHCSHAAPCRHPGARAHCPRQHACGAGRTQILSSIRARRTPRGARGPRALRQLPLLTLQHQHAAG